MASKQISDFTAESSAVASGDLFLIEKAANGAYRKLTSANLLSFLSIPQTSANNTFTGTLTQGSNSTDRVAIKGIYMNPSSVAVAVPSITDPDIARVQVDVSSAFSMQPAVGDAVIAIPQEALPTNCRLQGAWVYQTDGVEITFGSEGGNVTGANKNFKFLVIDLT